MIEGIEILKNLSKMFNLKDTRISEILNDQDATISRLRNNVDELRESLNIITRKNDQILHEMKRIQLKRTKSSSLFTKYSEDALKYSKDLVNQESLLESVIKSINETESILEKSKQIEHEINYPSQNKLYLELIKGLGVGFVSKKDGYLFTVKGKTNSYTVEGRQGELLPEIWTLLDK